jgi:hypothetical protein
VELASEVEVETAMHLNAKEIFIFVLVLGFIIVFSLSIELKILFFLIFHLGHLSFQLLCGALGNGLILLLPRNPQMSQAHTYLFSLHFLLQLYLPLKGNFPLNIKVLLLYRPTADDPYPSI